MEPAALLIQENLAKIGIKATINKIPGANWRGELLKKTLPMTLQWDESFDIGSDSLTGVNDTDYKPPFTFTGKLNKLTIDIDRPTLTAQDIKTIEAAEQAKAMHD